MRFSPITVYELERTEALFKFLYVLRDLGVHSAHDEAVMAWRNYMALLEELAGNR